MTPQERAEIGRRIGINEGRRNVVYHDSLKIPTVGIGFNCDRPDAAAVFAKLGTSLHDVLAGHPLTDAQVDALFAISFAPILEQAANSVANFGVISQPRRFVICDLVFNLGFAGWLQFVNTRKYISAYQFDAAANGLMASAWYKQVGGRAVRNVTMLRTGEWVPQ